MLHVLPMFVHPKEYDVIVVGAGHAGIEAALASARMGCRTMLTTVDLDTIGKMSCNPAIGGLAKGHMVREIDALGGQMGLTTDATGIQFRLLNRKKGPAVRAPRAQADKKAYQFAMKAVCERQKNLDIIQSQTTGLYVHNDEIKGIDTAMGVRYHGKCVVITTGTFLRGLLHIGENQQKGGRSGEHSSQGLSESLTQLGIKLERLKTGTPPRLNKNSIDWSLTVEQPGDSPPPPFSFIHEASYYGCEDPHENLLSHFHRDGVMFHVEQSRQAPSAITSWQPSMRQIACYLTSTTLKTAEIIKSNLHRSPLFCGQIEGVGPRYCPSIEDKYVKFPDKDTHQIFLEPEGLNTDEVYVNGCSTSLPYDVQLEVIHSIKGLEHAEMMRAGYAVEYDFAPPTQLHPWLETKVVKNLFFAGQINGTTGYEEAAAQGFVAGIEAALRIHGKSPYLFQRSQSYIGVLIDDLVTKGTNEPYRMFTSRAEYRLLMRQDNADVRLTPIGNDLGLISPERLSAFQNKIQKIEDLKKRLRETRVQGVALDVLLKRPEIDIEKLFENNPDILSNLPEDLISSVEMDIKYDGYVQRDLLQVERMKKTEEQRIPAGIDFQSIQALRRETRDKLAAIQPATVGQATRISGVTPADISVLLIWMKKTAVK